MQEPNEEEKQESDEKTTENLPDGQAKNDATAAEKPQKDDVKGSEERGSKKGERTIEESTIEAPKSEQHEDVMKDTCKHPIHGKTEGKEACTKENIKTAKDKYKEASQPKVNDQKKITKKDAELKVEGKGKDDEKFASPKRDTEREKEGPLFLNKEMEKTGEDIAKDEL